MGAQLVQGPQSGLGVQGHSEQVSAPVVEAAPQDLQTAPQVARESLWPVACGHSDTLLLAQRLPNPSPGSPAEEAEVSLVSSMLAALLEQPRDRVKPEPLLAAGVQHASEVSEPVAAVIAHEAAEGSPLEQVVLHALEQRLPLVGQTSSSPRPGSARSLRLSLRHPKSIELELLYLVDAVLEAHRFKGELTSGPGEGRIEGGKDLKAPSQRGTGIRDAYGSTSVCLRSQLPTAT